jgi:RHS repeat-associated protein
VYYVSKSFVQVVNSSGAFNFTYVYQNGQLVAQKNPDGTKIFIHADIEGSATVITNSTGGVIENTSYSPFGDVLTGGSKSRYGYEDKEKDSVVGDTDFNFRKYNPAWGIFLQPDNMISDTYNPQELNRYSFENNNPQKNVDPTGHNPYAAALLVGYAWGVGVYAWNNPLPESNGDNLDYAWDLTKYTGKMATHGAISGAAAVGTVALITSGGRFIAPKLTAKLGMVAIGATEYVGHQNLDNKKVDIVETIISGIANALPIPGAKSGTIYSATKVTKNTLKTAANIAASNAVSYSLTSTYSSLVSSSPGTTNTRPQSYLELATNVCKAR